MQLFTNKDKNKKQNNVFFNIRLANIYIYICIYIFLVEVRDIAKKFYF